MQGDTAQAFPVLDELLDRARRLARDHAGRVQWFPFGRSRAGEPLYALRIGTGPQRVLAYGFPQPDEPLGGGVLLYLAGLLLEETALLRRATWTLVPCVDPDGARLNEGWFGHPWDLRDFARRHYRPPEGEQVEWAFPSDDPAWPWDRVLPETQALQGLIAQVRPHVLLPLHNSLLGGAYAFASAGAQGLAAGLPPLWEAWGIPTHLGEPELPFASSLGPGVYALPTLEEIAAALAANGIADPAALLQCGESAYLWAGRLCDPLVVVPELPLFIVAGIEDDRPSGLVRRQVLAEVLEADRDAFAEWASFFARVAPFLEREGPHLRAAKTHQRLAPPLMEATARWLGADAALDRPATMAEVVDCRGIAPFVRLLALGTLLQAVESSSGWGGPPRELLSLGADLSACLDRSLDEALTSLEVRPVPLEQLARTLQAIVSLVVLGRRSEREATGADHVL